MEHLTSNSEQGGLRTAFDTALMYLPVNLHSRLLNFHLLCRCKVQGLLPAQKTKYPRNQSMHKLVAVEQWPFISESLDLFLLRLDCELSTKS